MTAIVAIDCHVVKQQIASRFRYDSYSMEARQILAKKLRELMESSGKYSDRDKISAGTRNVVSARTVGTMLDGKGNPTLKNIQAVAAVFKLEAWELLIDHHETKQRLISKILGAEHPATDAAVERAGFFRRRKSDDENE